MSDAQPFLETHDLAKPCPMASRTRRRFTQVVIGIPGSQYGSWVLRESAILGALAVASGGLATLVVKRRRP